jgi:hypothetical protein
MAFPSLRKKTTEHQQQACQSVKTGPNPCFEIGTALVDTLKRPFDPVRN